MATRPSDVVARGGQEARKRLSCVFATRMAFRASV